MEIPQQKKNTKQNTSKEEFVSELIWQVIEKIDYTQCYVRSKFNFTHRELLDLILNNTGTLNLDLLTSMSDQLSHAIFKSIVDTDFKHATELLLHEVLSCPKLYPWIVKVFKNHLENPPDKSSKKQSRHYDFNNRLYKFIFNTEEMFESENCLDCSNQLDPEFIRLTKDMKIKNLRFGSVDDRQRPIKRIVLKMVQIARTISNSNMDDKDAVILYKKLLPIIWEEVKDIHFPIFPDMHNKLSSDIILLFTGNNSYLERNCLCFLIANKKFFNSKLMSCIKRALVHPRKVHLIQCPLEIVWNKTKDAICKFSVNMTNSWKSWKNKKLEKIKGNHPSIHYLLCLFSRGFGGTSIYHQQSSDKRPEIKDPKEGNIDPLKSQATAIVENEIALLESSPEIENDMSYIEVCLNEPAKFSQLKPVESRPFDPVITQVEREMFRSQTFHEVENVLSDMEVCSNIKSLQRAEKTAVEREIVLSETSPKIYSDLSHMEVCCKVKPVKCSELTPFEGGSGDHKTFSKIVCRPIFIQVRPCNKVLENLEQAKIEGPQNQTEPPGNKVLCDLVLEDLEG